MTFRACATVIALILAGCEQASRPAPTFTVAPAAAALGEPLRVRIGDSRGGGFRRLTIDVRDALGHNLASRELLPDRPAGDLFWLDPLNPSAVGDLEVVLHGHRALGLAAERALRIPVDLRRPLQRPHLSGLYPEQRSRWGPYRWTDGCALGEIEDLGADLILHARYGCMVSELRTSWLRVGDIETPLGCDAGDAMETVRIPLEHSLWGGDPFLPFEIVTEPPFVPAAERGGDDVRELGLPIYAIVVALDAGPPASP